MRRLPQKLRWCDHGLGVKSPESQIVTLTLAMEEEEEKFKKILPGAERAGHLPIDDQSETSCSSDTFRTWRHTLRVSLHGSQPVPAAGWDLTEGRARLSDAGRVSRRGAPVC